MCRQNNVCASWLHDLHSRNDHKSISGFFNIQIGDQYVVFGTVHLGEGISDTSDRRYFKPMLLQNGSQSEPDGTFIIYEQEALSGSHVVPPGAQIDPVLFGPRNAILQCVIT